MTVDQSRVVQPLNGRLSPSLLPQDRKHLLHRLEIDRLDGSVGEHEEVVGVRGRLDSGVDEFVVVEEDSGSIGLSGGVVLHHRAEREVRRKGRGQGRV